MGLSRKRQRELKKLRSAADDLWDEQLAALQHANSVLRQAGRAASGYAREDVAPFVRKTYNKRVVPAVRSGLESGRDFADSARSRLSSDVIPAVSGAIGSVLASMESARDQRVREFAKNAAKANKSYGKKASKWVKPPKRSSMPGPGAFILIGLGVVAAAGVAYAAWQTFRADDDLWIEDLGDAPEGTASV